MIEHIVERAGFFIAGGIATIAALLWAGYIFARKAVSGR